MLTNVTAVPIRACNLLMVGAQVISYLSKKKNGERGKGGQQSPFFYGLLHFCRADSVWLTLSTSNESVY